LLAQFLGLSWERFGTEIENEFSGQSD